MKINKRIVAPLLMFGLGLLILLITSNENIEAKEFNRTNYTAPYTIILQTMYLDGELSEEVILEEDTDFATIRKEYNEWELVSLRENEVVLRKQVDDISPLLKVNGYFGISVDGSLSIFNGEPKDRNVIQSFYQLDIERMESRKQQELQKGIPVRTKDEFLQVLEAFKPYMITVQN